MSGHKLISICCITFNHEKYIAQALDSFLLQQPGFPYEIVVSDDCSTDGTIEILKQYAERYPDLVRLHTNTRNIGMMPNFSKALKACRGEYIAICEGDDYWTDPLKLQKQLAFLEQHHEYSVCFHRVLELSNGTEFKPDTLTPDPDREQSFNRYDLLKGNFMHTPSVVFRNNIDQIPEWVIQMPVGDYPLHLFNAGFGLIGYMPEPMAVYRLHNDSNWSALATAVRQGKWMSTLSQLIEGAGFNEKEQFILQGQMKRMYDQFEKDCFYTGNETGYLENIALLLEHKCFRNWWFNQVYTANYYKIEQFPLGLKSAALHLKKELEDKVKSKFNL